MTLTTPTPKQFVASFPLTTLTGIQGKPTYPQLALLRNELPQNAASVPSTLDSGSHGHIGLVLPASLYLNITAK